MQRIPRWASLLVLCSLCCLCSLLASCGASSSVPLHAAAGTATATLTRSLTTPTASSTPVPATTPGATFVACDPGVFSGAARFGDLLVTNVTFTRTADGAYQVPANTPLKPLQVDAIPPRDNFGRPPDTDPNMVPGQGGYEVGICNASKTRAHVIPSMVVRLDAFSPFSGPLDAWSVCSGPYDNQLGNVTYEGCGGAYQADYYLSATFAPNATIGTVTYAAVGTSNSGNPLPFQHMPLPAALAPNQAIFINLVLGAPIATGAYTLGLGLSVDAAAPIFVGEAPPTLIAPVTHWWYGNTCLAPAVKSQIPISPHAYYICP